MPVLRVITAAAVGAVLLASVAGCSADSVPAAPAASPAPASTASPTTAPPPAEVGQLLTNRGVQLTVKAVRSADSIDMNESGFRPGSGYEKYTKKKPDSGGKFVIVETHVWNKGGVSLDLTCSLPVSTAVADTESRNFDPIQDLYKIRGNPECNKQLQPGFESDMTWVFMVPASASIVRFGFYDSTNLGAAPQFSVFKIAA